MRKTRESCVGDATTGESKRTSSVISPVMSVMAETSGRTQKVPRSTSAPVVVEAESTANMRTPLPSSRPAQPKPVIAPESAHSPSKSRTAVSK